MRTTRKVLKLTSFQVFDDVRITNKHPFFGILRSKAIIYKNIVAKWVATEMLLDNKWVPVDTTQYLPATLFLTEDGYFWAEGMIYRNGAGKYVVNGNTVTTSDGKKLCRFETLTAFTAQAYVSDGEGGTIQLRFQRDESARYLYLDPKKWLIGTWRIDDIQGGIEVSSKTWLVRGRWCRGGPRASPHAGYGVS